MVGKYFPKLLICISLLTFLSACDFFGKKEDEGDNRAPGELSDGKSIVGSWSYTFAGTAADNNPDYAITETYTFEPNSSARIEVRDQHLKGITCTAYGQYRMAGDREVLFYLQAVTGSCGFDGIIHFANMQVNSQSIQYEDPQTKNPRYLFIKRTQSSTVTGLYDFKGAGGIDYLLLDHNGYFLMQVTEGDQLFLLLGYYSIDGGKISFQFFGGMDPTSIWGNLLRFSFATDGNVLQLVDADQNGNPLFYNGVRL